MDFTSPSLIPLTFAAQSYARARLLGHSRALALAFYVAAYAAWTRGMTGRGKGGA